MIVSRFEALAWLSLYFIFSLTLTLYNKAVMQMLNFHFPWLLTATHIFFGWIGCYFLIAIKHFTPSKLSLQKRRTVALFSILYNINIAFSNISLNLVTIPFHQVARSTVPIFTMVLSITFFNEKYSTMTYLSQIPIVVGVTLATVGDFYFTPIGFLTTFIGIFLAAIKTIVTNKLQTNNLCFHPLDLLYHMSPYALFQTLSFAWGLNEVENFSRLLADGRFARGLHPMTGVLLLAINGMIAFGLNFVSFTANGKTSPLMICVAGNMKQVMSIVLSVIIFKISVTPGNSFGIFLTLFGGVWYTTIELQRKKSGQSVLPTTMKDSILSIISPSSKLRKNKN